MTPVFLTDRAERLLRHLVDRAAHDDTPSVAEIDRALKMGTANIGRVQEELVRARCATWTQVVSKGRMSNRLLIAERGRDAVAGRVPIERKRNTMWKAVS